MTQQLNIFNKLATILSSAMAHGSGKNASGPILLSAMNLDNHPGNLVEFYGLLDGARIEAEKLPSESVGSDYFLTFIEFDKYFIQQHLWTKEWSSTAAHIKTSNMIALLQLMALTRSGQQSSVSLEEDFLNTLQVTVSSLFEQVSSSILSADLKTLLMGHLSEILSATRSACSEGSKNLEETSKSLLADLLLNERDLSTQDTSNLVFRRVKIFVSTFCAFFTFKVADVVGGVPAIQQYWFPLYEEFVSNLTESDPKVTSIQEMCEEAAKRLSSEPQKLLEGRDVKSLPPSKEKIEKDLNENEPDKDNTL